MKKLFTFFLASLFALTSFSQSKGLHFDGVNDYVSIPERAGVLTTGSFTVETWVKLSALPTQIAPLLHKMNGSYTQGLDIYLWDNGGFGELDMDLYLSGNIYSIYYTLPSAWVGVWHHLALTYNGSMLQLYIDGVAVQFTPASGSLNASGAATLLGYLDVNNPGYLNGTLDELRFWNTARSQAQIQASRSTEIAANTTGLTGYYRFNQGTVNGNNTTITSLTDQVSSNTGSLLNFARNGSTSNFTTGYSFLTVLAFKDGSFTAAKKEAGVQLSRSSTAAEETLTFTVERSDNGSQFIPIGTVNSPASITETKHVFTDRAPLPFNYYRIRSTTAAGKVEYSKILTVSISGSAASLSVFPNPASSVLQLQLAAPKGDVLVEIKNLAGGTVQTARMVSAGSLMNTTIDISKLAAGMYTITAGSSSTLFIKQ